MQPISSRAGVNRCGCVKPPGRRASHFPVPEVLSMSKGKSRREFLTTAAVTGSALAADWTAVANVHAGGTGQVIRVGLIGCGGRGTGAAEQCLSADNNVRLIAVGDAFRDRADACLANLRRNNTIAPRVTVDNELIFTGLNAYREVI